LYAFFITSICAVYHIHIILLDLIALTVLDEVYKLQNSSICTFLNVWKYFYFKCL
jgi:hypothetical protein